MNLNRKYILPIIAMITISLIGIAIAQYTMTSNHITGSTHDILTLTLDDSSANGSILIVGSIHTLKAVCSDTGFNGMVTFFNNGIAIDAPAQSIDGIATLSWTVPTGTFDLYAQATHA